MSYLRYVGLHIKCLLFCQIFVTLELSRQIFEKSSYQIHNLIRQMGAELFHADRRTDRHVKLIVAFRNFAKVPKNKVTKTLIPKTLF